MLSPSSITRYGLIVKNMNLTNYIRKQQDKKPIKKSSVYTVIDDFKLSKRAKKSAQVYPYESLSEEHREWILENAIRMIEHPTEAEIAFEQTLVRFGIDYEKQTFFRINGKDYFLDFYLPNSKIAIEIDGSVHRIQKPYDKFRDKEFARIGIRTIRIHNSKAYLPSILNTIEAKHKVRLR